MAVYEMTRKAIAEYLSETRNEFVLGCKTSAEGKRINKQGTAYPIQVIGLKNTQKIIPTVDCFLNADESIAIRVYLPDYSYFAVTRELHPAYNPADNLSFGFYVEPKTFEYTLPKKEVNSYRDFKEPMDDLIRRISAELSADINQFLTDEDWSIVGIKVDANFEVHSTNTK